MKLYPRNPDLAPSWWLIKSPEKLPNGLSVEDIKIGIQRRSRNVVLTSFANDILPYRGIGSGILKSLQLYPRIHFENNIAGEFFKVTIERELESHSQHESVMLSVRNPVF